MRQRIASIRHLLPTGLMLGAGLVTGVSGAVQERVWDAVVLTGDRVPTLEGVATNRIVAFRFDSEWIQIPIQVDERAEVDFGTIYGTEPIGYTVLTYADSSTFTGPDPDSDLDDDDEFALRPSDLGDERAISTEPNGVLTGTGVELTIRDPRDGAVAYAYLFESDGSLDPGMGLHAVEYYFQLLSGDYKTTYNTMSGPNPEDTWATTAFYAVHFADRWIRDETNVTSGGASGIDILDRHKALFAPGTCQRSEDTFSAGEGAFIINRQGPVRAIRGYVGANSGPTTYRIHTFYERHEELLTALRVHPIPGIMDFFDYSPEATGMTFHNDLNLAGVEIDGLNDSVVPGPFLWEMVTGPQGTLAMMMQVVTDIPAFDFTSYYLDDLTPPDHQCTGDDYAYGSSGLWEPDAIPNTDPAVHETYFIFEGLRTINYGDPNQDVSFAEARADEMLHPFSVMAEPYDPFAASIVGNEGSLPAGQFSIRLDPNPTAGRLQAHVRTDTGGLLELRLFSITGRQVAVLIQEGVSAGTHTFSFDLTSLPSGDYVAITHTPAGDVRTSRIVLIR